MVLLALVLACSPDGAVDTGSDLGDDVIDGRVEVPPAPEGGLQLVMPEVEIPPYTEQQWCFFGTYEGPDAGLHGSEGFQSAYGHHVTLLGTSYSEDEHPDGELFDCTAKDSYDMLRAEPLFIQGSYDPDLPGAASLPPGMAMELADGQRFMLQAHTINTTDKPLVVADVMNLHLVDEAEVETWAATFAHSTIGFSVPPGESLAVEIACEFEETLNVVNVSGHMHEWGTAFDVQWDHDGVRETLYTVPQWTPEYRDDAPMTDFGDAPLVVGPGHVFTTTCSWFNDGETALSFPEEMCATVGVVYPRREALTCVDF